MNTLEQWWENTYRYHQSKDALNTKEFYFPSLEQTVYSSEEKYADTNLLPQFQNVNYDNVENYTGAIVYDGDVEENAIPSITLLIMAISYGLVVFGGVLGNAALVLTLCSASSIRLRNPLLLAVCIADLLVTGISAPVTLLNLAMNRKTKSLPLVVCKVIHYIQVRLIQGWGILIMYDRPP